MTSTSAPKFFIPESAFSTAELHNFALLETAFGDTLWEVLRAYIQIGGTACEKLQEAVSCAHWQEAVRQSLKIASKAADLDFRAVTHAARAFAASVYEGNTSGHVRRNAAQMVIFEFERSCLALESRYPGLAAADETSIA